MCANAALSAAAATCNCATWASIAVIRAVAADAAACAANAIVTAASISCWRSVAAGWGASNPSAGSRRNRGVAGAFARPAAATRAVLEATVVFAAGPGAGFFAARAGRSAALRRAAGLPALVSAVAARCTGGGEASATVSALGVATAAGGECNAAVASGKLGSAADLTFSTGSAKTTNWRVRVWAQPKDTLIVSTGSSTTCALRTRSVCGAPPGPAGSAETANSDFDRLRSPISTRADRHAASSVSPSPTCSGMDTSSERPKGTDCGTSPKPRAAAPVVAARPSKATPKRL
ncbi:MAG: hypothetical protein ABIR94_08265 [Rubrivivax sp.]